MLLSCLLIAVVGFGLALGVVAYGVVTGVFSAVLGTSVFSVAAQYLMVLFGLYIYFELLLVTIILFKALRAQNRIMRRGYY